MHGEREKKWSYKKETYKSLSEYQIMLAGNNITKYKFLSLKLLF